jgi:hypothetical protein
MRNEKGSAIIGVLLVGLLSMAALFTMSRMSMMRREVVVHDVGLQRASAAAEIGIARALDTLRSPSGTIAPNSSLTLGSTVQFGRYEVTMTPSIVDNSLVDVWSTGYIHVAKGLKYDSVAGKDAEMAVIHATIKFTSVGSFLAAVPDSLRVGYGSDVSSGKVYARRLIFEPQGPFDAVSTTRIQEAYYYESKMNDTDQGGTWVTYTNPGFTTAQQLPAPLRLVALDSYIRGYFQEKVLDPVSQQIPAGSVISGGRSGPPSSLPALFYVPGDLTLGTPTVDLTTGDVFTIYVQGKAYINGNIQVSGSGWIAILAEDGIQITDTAPSNLRLNGVTLVTNGGIDVEDVKPAGNRIEIRGGMVAHGGINLSAGYTDARVYTYDRTTDSKLLLPNIATVMYSNLVQGKYN